MRAHGFTLIEAMVVLAIMGILLGMAIPSFNWLVIDTEMRTATNSMRRSLNLARKEAVTRYRDIRICASSDGENCNESANLGVGWIVYADLSPDPYRTSADPLIQAQPPLPNVTIKYNQGLQLLFNRHGRFGQNGSIHFCPTNSDSAPKRLVVIHSGRVRETDAGVNCT